jgi:hypothetical protein
MDNRRVLNLIRRTESPLRKQLLLVARVSRDRAKRKLLLDPALARIREMEREDYLVVGYRMRSLFIRGLSRT